MSNQIEMDNLVDIQDVCVDTTMSKDERIVEYVRQVKDPYHFISAGIEMRARFAKNGPPLEECLNRLMA